MIAPFVTQIEVDGQGVPWIGDTRIKVAEVVLDKIARGWSPEEISSGPSGVVGGSARE